MKYSVLIILTLFTFFRTSIAQDTSVLKRTPYKLTIQVDKDNYYEEQINETPYIWPDNTIQLYPGEKIYVEVEQDNWTITSMKAVKENKNPSKTLEISFIQTFENKIHKLMTLTVHNPFSRDLNYKAVISILGKKGFVPTDVYPVRAGIDGIEIWHDIITTIGLGHWTFSSK